MKASRFKTSLINRLQTTMVMIAVFSVIMFFGIYLSSMNMLNGLTSMNTTNSISSLTTQALQAMENTEKNLDKLVDAKKITDIKFSFSASQEIVKTSIARSIVLSEGFHPVHDLLTAAQTAVMTYDKEVHDLWDKIGANPDKKNSEEVKAEILVIQQFVMEAKEGLRKALISLKQRNDDIFSSIYEKRFYPLIVATVLSIVFFTFVVTFGFSISRKFRRSILNLTRATELVGEGDLTYRADILGPDEIGNLTNEFNKMVGSLREEKNQRILTLERIRRLQEITASFSEALTVDQVCEVTVKTGFEALGASAGTIALLKENNELEIRRSSGVPSPPSAQGEHFSLHDDVPLAETIRYSEPIFIEGNEKWLRRYPHLGVNDAGEESLHAWAFVPLEVASSKIGSLGFYFQTPKKFTKNEKAFIVAMGRQCAQAIHRSDLYDEARTAVQARDEFLSIASHELKTPLTSLKLQFQMLARRLKQGKIVSPEQLLKNIDASNKHTERLTHLIEDLLDVSRISTGRLTLNIGKYNLAEVITAIIAQYEYQLKDASNRVEVLGLANVECECDLVRIEQVLINLITNATKYAPGKPIKVRLERRDGLARITVMDQGLGIAPRDQTRIFERFERVSGKENIGGLGLGLYISKQIIRAHHGDIWVESEPGKGSTFIIEIPMNQNEIPTSIAQHASTHQSKGNGISF